jgi:ABC-type branched-subunit amino acid transport system ATPase component
VSSPSENSCQAHFSASSGAALLDVRGLNQSYGESRTLWDVDLDVPKGSCVSLIGRNGVGKTTLLG